MKIRYTEQPKQLADVVAWVTKAVAARPNPPIFGGLLINAGEDGVTISGYDGAVTHRAHVDATVASAGTVVVSAKLFSEILKMLPTHPLEIAEDASVLRMQCGNAEFTLPLLPVEDYPTLPEIPDRVGTVDSVAFARAIQQVAVAVNKNSPLPVLTGMYLSYNDRELVLAGTDRYRLAIRRLSWQPAQPGVAGSAVLPVSALTTTGKILSGVAERTTLAAGDHLFGLETELRTTVMPQLGGNYPDVFQVLPKAEDITASVWLDPRHIAEVVRRVMTAVGQLSQPVTLTLAPGELTVSTCDTSHEIGRGQEVVAGEDLYRHTGDQHVITFNASYLTDGLESFGSTPVVLQVTNPRCPALLMPAPGDTGENPDTHQYLLMPVNHR
ncbi:MAG: DNA polymerase III subunit beta [Limnochordales bacterium]